MTEIVSNSEWREGSKKDEKEQEWQNFQALPFLLFFVFLPS
jgi:hypothetical protein